MSRLTVADAYGLMEAYNNVYAPQELTEEQVWEEVETWVNSLLEEGYDLSDYTWEEMYESYLNEALMGDLAANAGNIIRGLSGAYQGAMRTASNVNKSITDRIQSNNKPKVSNLGPDYAEQERKLSQAANRSQIGTPRQGTAGGNSGLGNISPSEGTGRGGPSDIRKTQSRTNIPPIKPAASAAAPKPAAATPSAKPAMGPTGKPLVGGIERRTPTSAELKAAQAARAGGGALAQATAAASKPAAFNPTPTASTPTPAARPVTPAKPTPRQARLNMEMEYDTFDTVLEYLVAEGYADTNEAALAIMANMSEEWRQSIVEAVDPDYTGPYQDPLSRASRAIGSAVKFAMG